MTDNGFAADAARLSLSGPHFFVGKPAATRRRDVSALTTAHYDAIDLETIARRLSAANELPPDGDRAEYARRTPQGELDR